MLNLSLSKLFSSATFLVSWIFLRQYHRKKRRPFKVGHSIHIVDKPEDWDEIYDVLMEDIRFVRVKLFKKLHISFLDLWHLYSFTSIGFSHLARAVKEIFTSICSMFFYTVYSIINQLSFMKN